MATNLRWVLKFILPAGAGAVAGARIGAEAQVKAAEWACQCVAVVFAGA